MTPSQVLAGERAENVFRRGVLNVPLYGKCVICGDRFRQPSNGRPRVLCRKGKCQRERRNAQRRKYTGRGAWVWTEADFDEACEVWQRRCATCGQSRGWPLVPYVGGGLVPICLDCCYRPLSERALAWLARVKPGCPLPSPWVGGAK